MAKNHKFGIISIVDQTGGSMNWPNWLIFGSIVFGAIWAAYLIKKGSENEQEVSEETVQSATDPDSICLATYSLRTRAYKCGHTGPSRFSLSIYGEPGPENDSSEECPDCSIKFLKEYIIRCAMCGKGIRPNEPVALYDIVLNALPYAKVAYKIDERTALGCFQWNCCPSAGFFGGLWTGKAFVSAFPDSYFTEKDTNPEQEPTA